MKLKGIWVAIAVICVAGIGITDYSARHLAGSEAQYVSGEAAQQAVSGQADTAPVKTEAAAEAARAFSVQNTAAEPGEEPLSENARIMAQADLPEEAEDTAGRIAMEKEERQPGTKTGILAQLAELDDQAEKRRSVSADSSANALKAAAESERKIWESKMQSILETLEQQLSGDEKTAFFTEQRSWVRDRESAAVANSKKQSGSALEELEYIRSLCDLTRERVYDLAGRYETILDKTE